MTSLPEVPRSTRLRLARPDSAQMAPPMIAGVASGVASYFGLPVALVRTLFLVLAPVSGFAYLGLWALTPVEPADDLAHGGPLARPLKNAGGAKPTQMESGRLLIAGAVFVVAGLALLLAPSGSWGVLGPVVALLGGIGTVWLQAPRLKPSTRASAVALIIVGLLLVGFGVALGAQSLHLLYELRSAVFLSLAILTVMLLALAPVLLRMYRDLGESRVQQAVESERTQIAAHLHDSVLQTLTLIRGAADDPARVRALALGQERELRGWLYTGAQAPSTSAVQMLRDQAKELELQHGVPVEVITVSDVEPGPAEAAAVAAAGEAIKNAVRHGRPPVTVFMEVTAKVLDLSVKDCGAGFEVDSVPDDRHGVRHSIIGRVEAHGGTVQIRSRSNAPSGTEVRIEVPRGDHGRSVNN